jgi:hypothetical protein
MDVEKTIEFILNSQAQSEARLGRLQANLDALAVTVNKLADRTAHLDEVMVVLAESHIKSIQRMDTIAQQSEERDRQLGQRIESLVSAIGEFIRNRPITG